MAQTKAQLVVGLNVNASAPASALQIDASGNINLDSNTLYVDAANNRVGIGTSSPSYTLDVTGSARITSASPMWLGTTTGDAYIQYGASATTANNWTVGSQADGSFRFFNGTYSSGTERLRITSSGNVGIGSTSDPGGYNARLWIDNTTDSTLTLNTTGSSSLSQIVFRNSNGNGEARLMNGTGGPLTFYRSFGNEAARIDTSGRLLVGTSTATNNLRLDEKFAVVGTSASYPGMALTGYTGTGGDYSPILEFQRSCGTTDGSFTKVENGDCLGKIIFRGADGSSWVNGASIEAYADAATGVGDLPTRLVFSTTADGASSPTERMTINSAGTVRFGYGQSWADRGNTKGISTPDFRVWNNTSNQFIIDNYTLGVKLDGGATAWSSTSDERQKTNLEPIENGLGKIAALRAVTGRYLTDAEDVSRSFLIAQDVQAVLPEAVSVESDEDATLSLRYTEVIPLLVAALKESKERIEQLETKVAALETK